MPGVGTGMPSETRGLGDSGCQRRIPDGVASMLFSGVVASCFLLIGFSPASAPVSNTTSSPWFCLVAFHVQPPFLVDLPSWQTGPPGVGVGSTLPKCRLGRSAGLASGCSWDATMAAWPLRAPSVICIMACMASMGDCGGPQDASRRDGVQVERPLVEYMESMSASTWKLGAGGGGQRFLMSRGTNTTDEDDRRRRQTKTTGRNTTTSKFQVVRMH